MSSAPYYQPPGYQRAAPKPQESNVVGLVGFILTLVSIATCFTLSPIGLLVSLIGVRKPPRTFALIGTYLGLAFTVILLVAAAFFLSGVFATSALATAALEENRNRAAFAEARTAIENRWLETGEMPDEADGNQIAAQHEDAWGNPLRYERKGDLARLVSAGPDGQFDSDDDIPYGDFR